MERETLFRLSLGYISWFKQRCNVLFLSRVLDKAAPVPAQEFVHEKRPLQLVVQLLKRWRDLYYTDAELAPISIVLTTLAGHAYRGERSVSQAFSSVLDGIVGFIDAARRSGVRLRVWNPANSAEDLSERWEQSRFAYASFESGIRDLHIRWSRLVARTESVNTGLEKLFGEPVKAVFLKRASQRRDARMAGELGVTGSGLITSLSSAAVPIRPHTFYGEE